MQQKVDTANKLGVSDEQWQARVDLAAAHLASGVQMEDSHADCAAKRALAYFEKT